MPGIIMLRGFHIGAEDIAPAKYAYGHLSSNSDAALSDRPRHYKRRRIIGTGR